LIFHRDSLLMAVSVAAKAIDTRVGVAHRRMAWVWDGAGADTAAAPRPVATICMALGFARVLIELDRELVAIRGVVDWRSVFNVRVIAGPDLNVVGSTAEPTA